MSKIAELIADEQVANQLMNAIREKNRGGSRTNSRTPVVNHQLANSALYKFE